MRGSLLCIAALVAVSLPLTGCNAPDKKYSQTELNALQTREFEYPYDATFDATVGAVFDLGYTVFASDKRAGLLRVGGPHGGGAQIKLDQLAPRRTSVRVSTLSGGQAHVDKGRIDEFLNTIDRRLNTGGSPPAPGNGK